MASDLTRGAYSGKETLLQHNTATHAAPAWSTFSRVRNLQVSRGAPLSEINFHGAAASANLPGYPAFSGSFELVRRRGVDADYDTLKNAADTGGIICLRYLNGPEAAGSGSTGWTAPVLIGEFSETSNGGDGVVANVTFGLADAFDGSGDPVGVEDVAAL